MPGIVDGRAGTQGGRIALVAESRIRGAGGRAPDAGQGDDCRRRDLRAARIRSGVRLRPPVRFSRPCFRPGAGTGHRRVGVADCAACAPTDSRQAAELTGGA